MRTPTSEEHEMEQQHTRKIGGATMTVTLTGADSEEVERLARILGLGDRLTVGEPGTLPKNVTPIRRSG